MKEAKPLAIYVASVERPYRFNAQNLLGWRYVDRDEWLAALVEGRFKPKAPKWWLRSQAEDEGRHPPAVFAIWAKYPPVRKHLIWSMAPDQDFTDAGYRMSPLFSPYKES